MRWLSLGVGCWYGDLPAKRRKRRRRCAYSLRRRRRSAVGDDDGGVGLCDGGGGRSDSGFRGGQNTTTGRLVLVCLVCRKGICCCCCCPPGATKEEARPVARQSRHGHSPTPRLPHVTPRRTSSAQPADVIRTLAPPPKTVRSRRRVCTPRTARSLDVALTMTTVVANESLQLCESDYQDTRRTSGSRSRTPSSAAWWYSMEISLGGRAPLAVGHHPTSDLDAPFLNKELSLAHTNSDAVSIQCASRNRATG